MVIKRYIVNNMNEAITRIRYELGSNAVIISQRKIRKPGIKGFFSNKVIEVTAAVDNSKVDEGIEVIKKAINKSNIKNDYEEKIEGRKSFYESKQEDKVETNKFNREKEVEFKSREAEVKTKEVLEVKETVKEKEPSKEKEILSQIDEMKGLLNLLIKDDKNEIEEDSTLIRLKSLDINENIANYLISDMESVEDKNKEIKMRVSKMVETIKPKSKGVVVLVGPTGVGKTTTIAKLAGRFALMEKKKVGLITIDTYRIGAVEQLKTYAEIMGIPFRVVINPKDMNEAVKSMDDCEMILVDTTGRSSKNTMQIVELRAYIDRLEEKEVHLVISGTTKNSDIKAIIEGYKPLGFESLIITKLDETTTYGPILNILDMSNKPIAYITEGQSVPDDIKEADKEYIVNLILGEDSIC